ncbi:hypothetical protein [Beijerinckia mobilis]|uniref:hypothetical protein n=1 Tax=Beijerinckia mobilis TaxID=231434 RepID=UPI0012EB0901|nr:hypothetical protein [Beijerinckia mobilis]
MLPGFPLEEDPGKAHPAEAAIDLAFQAKSMLLSGPTLSRLPYALREAIDAPRDGCVIPNLTIDEDITVIPA